MALTKSETVIAALMLHNKWTRTKAIEHAKKSDMQKTLPKSHFEYMIQKAVGSRKDPAFFDYKRRN